MGNTQLFKKGQQPIAAWTARGCLLVLLVLAAGCNGMRAQGLNAEGTQYYLQGNYHAATQKFAQAINTDPNNPDSFYNLAVTHHQLGKLNQNQGEFSQAERLYHQCLDLNGDHVDCYRGLAVMLVEQENSEAAFRLLQGWVQRTPDSPDARVELARLNEEFGNRAKAKSALEEALHADPYNARALAALGRIYEEMGDPRQALLVYERSLSSNGLQPEVAQRVATLRTSLGGYNARPPQNNLPGGTRTVTTPGSRFK